MEEVLCTRTLQAGYARPVERDLENYLANSIRRVLGAPQQGIAQVGANLALEACNAGSAGVSLLDPKDHEAGFKWTALTGLVFEFTNGCSPRHDSACGDATDAHQPLLFRNPARRFTWMQQLPVQVHELLVAPIYDRNGKPAGTVWAVHHANLDHFDATDLHYLAKIAELMSGQL